VEPAQHLPLRAREADLPSTAVKGRAHQTRHIGDEVTDLAAIILPGKLIGRHLRVSPWIVVMVIIVPTTFVKHAGRDGSVSA
jgi:hypothetical protein